MMGEFQRMKFYQFDPRPQGATANEEIFNAGQVLGIEVTVPALAARCMGNLDHHGPGDTSETPSACEQALGYYPWPGRPCCGGSWDTYSCPNCDGMQIPPEIPAGLATVRPDADSITAMAVIHNLVNAWGIDPSIVADVGRFDRLGPSVGKPSQLVTAIARKSADHKIPLEERVLWVANILTGADKRQEIAELCSAHEAELEAARKASELTLRAGGRIAVVVSTHRFATTLGYESASVVVAFNPAMVVDPRDASKGTYAKFTVCRYDSHTPCDLPAALAELQALEPGWGGRGDIFGSPQGVSTELILDQVVAVVEGKLLIRCPLCSGLTWRSNPENHIGCRECGQAAWFGEPVPYR